MLAITSTFACQHSSTRWGLQDSFLGEVPAQIILLPCINLKPSESPQLVCEGIDQFVEKSFSMQVQLRALSNRLTRKVATEHKIDISPKTMLSFFTWPKRKLKGPASFLDRYAFLTKNKTAWRDMLRDLRLKTRFSDAVFLPMLLDNHRSGNGGVPAQRTRWLGLLLDPLTGKVLWAQKASATVQGQVSAEQHRNELNTQLYRLSFWHEFPGWSDI